MRLLDWLRPPRHLLLLFAGVTLVPAAVLVWLGWQFIDLDRGAAEQEISRRLNTSIEHLSSEIARQLASTAADLPDWFAHPPEALKTDAALVRINSDGVVTSVGEPLLFTPGISINSGFDRPRDSAAQARWTEAEAFEYRERNFEKAAEAFGAFARASEPDTRAMGLLATARNLRNLKRPGEALEMYRALKTLTTATVVDQPAELVGRAGECTLLEELGRREELTDSARRLADDLVRGRWTVGRDTFEARVAQLRVWTSVSIDAEALTQALAIESFWTERLNSSTAPSGNRAFTSDGHGVILIWQVVGHDVIALAGGQHYVARAWKSLLSGQDARVSFDTGGPYSAKVRAADVGLPWDLHVSDTLAAADLANSVDRSRLLGWSLAALVVLIPAGGYMVWRAVQRELAVAQLQADFVSAVSHEFRTPLTSMAHLTERLQRDRSIPDNRKRQYYDVLARDTDRLRRFVETLLDFGRMEAGGATVRAKDADLAAAVSEVVAEFRGDSAAANREIRFETDGGTLPAVRLDREAFGRALWNLLDNASKYSPAGAPISVAIRCEPRTVRVDVSDRGAGIPPSERRQIFQKFVRGEESRTARIKGTGVGLALVDRIIRAHGGEVRLESVVGQGSTFSLVLPTTEAKS